MINSIVRILLLTVLNLQKRFKRLKRAVEDSDGEQEEDPDMDREVIANQLFDGDDVSSNKSRGDEENTFIKTHIYAFVSCICQIINF